MKYVIEPTNDFFLKDTSIENLFISEYMISAPSDYVKVYIFGAMCSQHNMDLETKVMASTLGITEEKVLKAWEYWETMGAIKRLYIGEDGELDFSVQFLKLKNRFYSIGLDTSSEESESAENGMEDNYKSAETNVFGNEEIKTLIKNLEKIIGTQMTTFGFEAIINLVNERHAQVELIDYAAQYSANRQKGDMRYIVKVVENWLDKGIRDKESAIRYIREHDERHFIYSVIMKTLFGYDRPANLGEKEMMNRWLDDDGFSLERILEACKKTTGIREPNFNYVNKVLEGWKKEETKGSGIENKPIEVTSNDLENYLRFLREEAQTAAKQRATELFSKYPEVRDVERRLQEAYRERIVKGSRGGAATKAEYDKLIQELKERKGKLLNEYGLGADYLEPKYKCDICADTCITGEGVCTCKPLRMAEAKEWILGRSHGEKGTI